MSVDLIQNLLDEAQDDTSRIEWRAAQRIAELDAQLQAERAVNAAQLRDRKELEAKLERVQNACDIYNEVNGHSRGIAFVLEALKEQQE